MEKYISLLRGINVSGKNSIKMVDLQKRYEALGFENVVTYIQSGNVVFESKEKESQILTTKIKESIAQNFGFNVPVLIREKHGMQNIIKNNPFENRDTSKIYVTLFSEPVPEFIEEEILKVKDDAEEYFISDSEIFLFCGNGYGRTKLSNNFLEKKSKITATTRNWKTLNKLLEIASMSD